MLTKNLAMEWVEHNIRVNAIGPGYILTPLNPWMTNDPVKTNAAWEMTPMKRFGQPEEIASVAVFLASPGASFITGQTIFADGGYTCW